MRLSIQEWEEEENKKQVEEAERDAFDREYWDYNPHEDAGDRV